MVVSSPPFPGGERLCWGRVENKGPNGKRHRRSRRDCQGKNPTVGQEEKREAVLKTRSSSKSLPGRLKSALTLRVTLAVRPTALRWPSRRTGLHPGRGHLGAARSPGRSAAGSVLGPVPHHHASCQLTERVPGRAVWSALALPTSMMLD